MRRTVVMAHAAPSPAIGSARGKHGTGRTSSVNAYSFGPLSADVPALASPQPTLVATVPTSTANSCNLLLDLAIATRWSAPTISAHRTQQIVLASADSPSLLPQRDAQRAAAKTATQCFEPNRALLPSHVITISADDIRAHRARHMSPGSRRFA